MKSRENGLYTMITRVSGVAIAAMTMLASGAANAQLPMPTSTQFDLTGPIQAATLDTACRTDAHCGGTITIQGHTVVVPKETIVLYPANATTWQEMFFLAPAPYGLGSSPAGADQSGLSLSDLPLPLANFEGHVVGNRVLGGPGGADLYIAGLVYVTSSSLNTGAGFINFIDYALGELRVGGTINDPNCAQGGTAASNPLCSGARVRINDPTGRFGRNTTSPDVRFGVDPENPTIMAGTGFPMCFPRVNPAAAVEDALCPQAQRPSHIVGVGAAAVNQFDTAINMNDPRLAGLAGVPPDATVQAPLEVGDFVMFAGLIAQDTATPTAGPWPLNGTAGTYVSAWAITSNVAIYTAPGSNPAYIMVDTALIGTGGLTVIGAGEAVIRTKFEGMTTDTGRTVHLYGIDFDPTSGATSDRDFGVIDVDPGPPNGAVKGRWRFRPPCAQFGTVPAKPDKQCVMNSLGVFLPPPREVRAVLEGAWLPNAPAGTIVPTAANGITWGQYRNPAIEYIFPENVPGTPIVPNNFNTIPFLTGGGYPSSTGVIPGQLNPWPDSVIPTPACTPATASANGPYTVAAGGTTALTGTANGTGPFTFAWAASSGSVNPANTANATFSAAGATSPVTLTLTVTGQCGTATNSTTITVNAARAPTVSNTPAISVFSGARGTFTVTATDPNTPAQSVTFAVAQNPASLIGLTVSPTGARSATVTFTAPTLPAGSTASVVINLSITARNTGGTTSAADLTTVTVNPIPDSITGVTAQYRLSKQRLSLTAVSSVVSPNVVLTLQPYLTKSGATFDPSNLGAIFANTGGGNYTLTLVGAPEPTLVGSPIVITSSLGGSSGPQPITERP